jgi:predicted RNA-binding Zn-ribbon protein involved in translation (DUF1610 family)
MLQLEPYKSKSSRYTCPACGQKRVFSRYVDDAGQPIDETVGRCNREVECGYHLKPREFFAQHPTFDWTPRPATTKSPPAQPVLTEIPGHYFERSQANREPNAFVRFLLSRYNRADVVRVCEAYGVGDFESFTTFWRKDTGGKLWTAKLVKYDAATGKRCKGDGYSMDWLHALLKRRGVLPENSDYRRVLFGAHLVTDDAATVAIVEAEKTAIVAALELPEFVWLASGGRTQINVEKLAQLGQRRALLFPDGDTFEEWSKLAQRARANGLDVHVSDLLETELTEEQKRAGYDLADYFLATQSSFDEAWQATDATVTPEPDDIPTKAQPCPSCAASMEQIAAGYFSCPACHTQTVAARSDFWTDWLTPEELSGNEKLVG